MKAPRALTWITLLSAVGFIVEIFQTRHFFMNRLGMNGFSSFCDWQALGGAMNCQAIDASRFAEVIPGFPLSSFGMGFFAVLFALSLWARSPLNWKVGFRLVARVTLFGAAVSLFYLVIMALVLKKFCLLCLTVDTINFLALFLAYKLKPDFTSPLDKARVRALAMPLLGLFIAGPLFGQVLNPGGPSKDEMDRAFAKYRSAPVMKLTPSPHSPTIGAEYGDGGKVVDLVKFSDFQCPACRSSAFALHPVLKKYGNRVRFEFRNFPLSSGCNRMVQHAMHPFACEAAKAVLCAKSEGKFAQLYETIFENQADISSEKILTWAEEAGIPRDKLKACMESAEIEKQVKADVEEGIRLEVGSTPTFFLNGKKIVGGLPPQLWDRLIEAELKP